MFLAAVFPAAFGDSAAQLLHGSGVLLIFPRKTVGILQPVVVNRSLIISQVRKRKKSSVVRIILNIRRNFFPIYLFRDPYRVIPFAVRIKKPPAMNPLIGECRGTSLPNRESRIMLKNIAS